jgi:formate dehydrogenase major subunit
MADHALYYLRPRPGTDVALYNGMMNVILGAGLHEERFIRERTENFEALRQAVASYTPEVASRITGVDAGLLRDAALAYGSADRAITFWGMGISQHTTGTDNARCLISLCLLTGNIGRPGTGLHPLRGQNNVQGASDSGLIPMFYPDYQPVADAGARRKFEAAWGAALDPRPGLTVTEIVSAALDGKIRGMLMFGENPFLSDPNINKVRRCLAALEFLAVQDIFLTETAEFADVILPAAAFPEKDGTYTSTDRRVQIGRRAIDPPGQARPDWQVLIDLARRLGADWRYDSPEAVFRELCSLSPSLAGLTYGRLGTTGAVWPLRSAEDPEQPVLFGEAFPRGRGRFVPCEYAPARELPDSEYPLVLNTGRVLEHWHTGTMTRRSKALDALSPAPFVEIHPADAGRLGIRSGDWVRVSSRRGEVRLGARLSARTPPGSVFIPFHFREAAANMLTIDALDPFGKIPEFKVCAVRIERIDEASAPPA